MPQVAPATGPKAPTQERIQYIPYKAGHPRWNLAVVLVIIGLILAFALIEAERLALGL